MNKILSLALLVFFAQVCYAVKPKQAAIASAHPLAIEAGHEILNKGGNAFDAAIAVSAVLSVVEPQSSGIGGGGFWLLHQAENQNNIMIDAREEAPLAAHRDMYLKKNGDVNRDLAINGPLAAGIPGTVAAMAHISEKYGRLSLSEALQPAIQIANQGFPAYPRFSRSLESKKEIMHRYQGSKDTFYKKNGDSYQVGEIVIQHDLAKTLETIAKKGHKGFYQGKVAKKLVKSVQKYGGNWSLQDLKNYKIVERKPIYTNYKGKKLVTASPPSSGGIAIATMLNILSAWNLDKIESSERKHLIVESMRRAFRDRSVYLGDPDFVDIPTKMLTHPFYAEGLRASISMKNAMPSKLLPGLHEITEGDNTTHFSIIDTEGNMVATTQTVNTVFGSKFVAEGTGVTLNNEMDDFSAKPLEPNAYGLIGGEANAIVPGKRPLSSMTPTFVIGDDDVAVIGTPGGSRIITMVLLGLLDFFEGNSAESWVKVPRFHHQYVPDKIYFEPNAFTDNEVAELEAKGHKLHKLNRTWGNMNVAYWNKKTGETQAATDPRGGKAFR